jgi:aminoglycoside phosphotransferase (APT) family kinase protein
VGRVRAAFPDLIFERAEIEDRGGDHRVLLLDNEYAFRFPRTSHNHLALELAVLSAVRPICEVPLPHYQFVAPDLSFAGYRFLHGIELTAALFGSLARPVQDHILDQAICLLNALHALDPLPVAEAATWRQAWTAREFTKRGRQRLPALARTFPALVPAIEEFYHVYESDRAPHMVVLHGDLVEEHFLLTPDHDGLSGVLDFGDVALGDPADDLKGLWAYGARAATYAAVGLDRHASDRGLLGRSWRAHIRYRVDRFVEKLVDEGPDEVTTDAENLQRLLTDASSY